MKSSNSPITPQRAPQPSRRQRRAQKPKQRAQAIRQMQLQKIEEKTELIEQMHQNGGMFRLAELLRSNHILMSAMQVIFDEIDEHLLRHGLHLKGFRRRFDNIIKANNEMFSLMSRVSDQDDTLRASRDIDVFMRIFSDFVGFNPFGIDLIEIELNQNKIMAQFHAITYNKIRLANLDTVFNLTELRKMAKDAKAPYYSRIIPQLRRSGYIETQGKQFKFAQKPIPIEFFEEFAHTVKNK